MSRQQLVVLISVFIGLIVSFVLIFLPKTPMKRLTIKKQKDKSKNLQ